MDKTFIYESSREVPANAKKAIAGGRLKGMTDINPMWRVKKLTELFGPAGIGWRFDAPVFEEKQGVRGEVMVLCYTNLYIRPEEPGDKWNDWSAPIPGVGGSMLIVTEKDGQRTDDEAYKKAYTDAQSVACKALGIGADVYWDKDKTKYDRAEPQTPPRKKAESTAPAQIFCACCGKPIQPVKTKNGLLTAEDIAAKAKGKYGRFLCWECAKKQPKEDGGLTHA